MDIVFIIIGLALVLAGANFLTEGAAAVAEKFHVSEFVIGLTIVAVGTSMPEFVVSSSAAFRGSCDMAIGNVVGSNIFNVFLILGLCALISPLPLTKNNVRFDIPLTFLASFILFAFTSDTLLGTGSVDRIGRIEGAIMFLCYIALMIYTIRTSKQDNPAGNADEMGGKLNYAHGWHYNWTVGHGLRLMAGAEVHTGIGAIYNNRNSNNPVQAKAELDLGATVMAIYLFRIRKTPFTARYQASLPLLGGMFSPQYGQSYYEMSLGNYDHNVCFTHPGNAPSMRHFLTLDFPVAGLTFRAGYLCDIRQSRVNGLQSHIWNHSFMIGYVKHFSFVKRKEPQHRPFIL